MKKSLNLDELFITTDKSKLNLNLIHKFLRTAYWSKGRSAEIINKSIKNSLCFGVYNKNEQLGFARVVTDYSIFAYMADVFILEDYRDMGIGKRLIQTILGYPELKDVKRWMLATTDAHKFYSQFGFKGLEHPEKVMELKKSNSQS
jgi:N-acetylglutamate synthase-like GNAT family acetyltransferase